MKTSTTRARECRARQGIELRAVSDDEKAKGFIGSLEGAIPFNSDSAELRDRSLNNGKPFVERIAPDAFTRSIAEDKDIMGFAGHTDDPLASFARIGENMTITQDADSLKYRALIPDTQAGRDLKTLAEKNIIRGTSFEFALRGNGSEKWERRDGKDVRTITEARLFAVNPVAWPAYDDSTLTVSMRSRSRLLRGQYLYNDDDYSNGDPTVTPDTAYATAALNAEFAELHQALEYLRACPDGDMSKYAKSAVSDCAKDMATLVAFLTENGADVNDDDMNGDMMDRAKEKLAEARAALSPKTTPDDDRERRYRALKLRSAQT